MAAFSMAGKLMKEAERRWRRLNGHKLLCKMISGLKLEDGIEAVAA